MTTDTLPPRSQMLRLASRTEGRKRLLNQQIRSEAHSSGRRSVPPANPGPDSCHRTNQDVSDPARGAPTGPRLGRRVAHVLVCLSAVNA